MILLFVFVIISVYCAPPEWVMFTVFDVSYRDNNGTTVVLTYGQGKYILQGYYTLELGHTYCLTYKTAPGGRSQLDCIVLELEEVQPP